MAHSVDDDRVQAAADVARVGSLRSWMREHSPGPPVREVVGNISYQLYVTVLLGGLWGTAVARTLSSPPSLRPHPPAGLETVVPALTVGLAFLLTAAGIRIGTWAGPLLVSRPQAAMLLPAPLDRRVLFQRTLLLGLAAYGALGAGLGLLLGVIVALTVRVTPAATVVGTTAAWATLGVATGGAALLVESSRSLAHRALRSTPLLAVGGAGLVWLAATRPAMAAWATPWGWASTSVTVAVGAPVPSAWAPLLVLTALAAFSVVVALRRLPDLPDEELVRRAGTASEVRTSVATFDARAIAQARRSGQQRLLRLRSVRIRRPRQRWLLVAWRDLVSLLRRPGLTERTLVTVVGAGALVAWAGGLAAIVGAVLLASLAAGQLLEPLRVELEVPVIRELTGLALRDVALEHLVVPFASMALSGMIAAVVMAVVGAIPWSALGAAMLGGLLLAALLTATAGLTSTRGAPPLQWLLTGQGGIAFLAAWVLAGPILAVVLAVPLCVGVALALENGQEPLAAIIGAAPVAIALTIALVATTRWRVSRHEPA